MGYSGTCFKTDSTAAPQYVLNESKMLCSAIPKVLFYSYFENIATISFNIFQLCENFICAKIFVDLITQLLGNWLYQYFVSPAYQLKGASFNNISSNNIVLLSVLVIWYLSVLAQVQS